MESRKLGYVLLVLVAVLVLGLFRIDLSNQVSLGSILNAIAGPPNPADFGLKDGDMISATGSSDPDIYIVNSSGYKRLFLNPAIFGFYGHLGGFQNVKTVSPQVRDTFTTSGLFRNCETNDIQVYGVEVKGEDEGVLHWVNTTGDQAIKDDPDFFKKTFCINNNEFKWYGLDIAYTSVAQIPQYSRAGEVAQATPSPTTTPASTPSSTKFSIGNTVRTNANGVNVRDAGLADAKILGTQNSGATGKVVGGPSAKGTDSRVRWNINFDLGFDGWVAEAFLDLFSSIPGIAGTGSSVPGQPTPIPTPKFALPPRGQDVLYSISGGDATLKFVTVDINPLHVYPGDTQNLTVKIESTNPIQSVTAVTTLDTKTLTLNLADDGTGTKTWKTSWVVNDTHVQIYRTKFIATDSIGNSVSTNLSWSDPCSGFSDNSDSTLGSDCTISVVDGVENGNITIPSGTTLTLNPGGKLVYNPGKGITINGAIAIAKGAELNKGYSFYDDTDGDTYPESTVTKFFNTSSTFSGHIRTTSAGAFTDVNDSNASCWRNRYTDSDGDGVGTGSTSCVGNEAGFSDTNTDCATADATKWVTRSCFVDADNDVATVGAATNVCKGSACNSPTGHQVAASAEADCDDADATKQEASECYSYAQAYYYSYAQAYYYSYAYGQAYYYSYAYGYGQAYYYSYTYAQAYYYSYAYGYGEAYYYGYGEAYYYGYSEASYYTEQI